MDVPHDGPNCHAHIEKNIHFNIIQYLAHQLAHYKFQSKMNSYLTEVDVSTLPHDKKPIQYTPKSIKSTMQDNPKSSFSQSLKFKEIKRTSSINKFFDDHYYRNKAVKPGLSLYRYIVEGQELRKTHSNLNGLKINIPPTLIYCDNSYQLIYTENGSPRVENDATSTKWLNILNKNAKQINFPVALHASGAPPEYKVIMSKEIDNSIMPKNEIQAVTKYTTPFAFCPNILRLFYLPSGIRTNKKSHAYKITNKAKITEELLTKKHLLNHYFLVDLEKEKCYEKNLIKGKALQQVETMAQSLVEFLEGLKKVKITEIVLDFTLDQNRIYWLHEVVSIKSVKLNSLWDVGTEEEIIRFGRESSNHVKCKLCGYHYGKLQLPHQVTNKLILELILHMQSRGMHISKEGHSMRTNLSGKVSVCSICFELILAEHNLINIERQFCKIINISSNQVQRVPLEKLRLGKQSDLIEEGVGSCLKGVGNQKISITGSLMNQWRVFFYISKIKQVQTLPFIESTLTMKFKGKVDVFRIEPKEHQNYFHSESSRRNTIHRKHQKCPIIRNPSINSKSPKKSTFPTHHSNRTNEFSLFSKKIKPELQVNKIKVLVMYTKETTISTFIKNQEIEFELKIGQSKYHGSSATLQTLGNKKECQRHGCQILLFDENLKFCNLELTVGLVCDGSVDTENLSLYQGQDPNVWFSDRIRNCNPLPEEWMEIFYSEQSSQNQHHQEN